MFHRQYMHKILMDTALGEGEGPVVKLVLNHRVSHCEIPETRRELTSRSARISMSRMAASNSRTGPKQLMKS
jgi:hypothetical protein